MSQMAPTGTVIEIAYVTATALFILSLKWLSSPTTARRGVLAGEAGMVLAITGTLLDHSRRLQMDLDRPWAWAR